MSVHKLKDLQLCTKIKSEHNCDDIIEVLHQSVTEQGGTRIVVA